MHAFHISAAITKQFRSPAWKEWMSSRYTATWRSKELQNVGVTLTRQTLTMLIYWHRQNVTQKWKWRYKIY